jgi:hypothetical protein
MAGGEGGDEVGAITPRKPGVRIFARFALIRAAACADGSAKLLRKKEE